MKRLIMFTAILYSIFILTACEKLAPSSPADDERLDGLIVPLSNSESIKHFRGDTGFNRVFTSETGLGPVFVATSCASCHAGDGKGHPFTTLIRFGQSDSTGNLFIADGGPQLQNRALPGFTPEHLPIGATYAKFTPPAVTGLGFLELVSDVDILAMADPTDANGDGISGNPNWNSLPSYVVTNSNALTQNGKYICRFGKKAGVYNLLQQTVNAYNEDIGITSIYNPKDVYSFLDIDPEISTQIVHDVVFYLQTLKAPIQRQQNDAEVLTGKQVFANIGCNACHKETLKTGYSAITALSNKEFHPYTDLLLHDMGSGLDDGYTEGSAKTNEWRTPPLWGLGLSPHAQGGSYFLLHDGRARSIEEAILLHGGEGSASKKKFQNLSQTAKTALLKFLKSL
jgi:CxxC motif-containing protein (DUF1111 family)